MNIISIYIVAYNSCQEFCVNAFPTTVKPLKQFRAAQ